MPKRGAISHVVYDFVLFSFIFKNFHEILKKIYFGDDYMSIGIVTFFKYTQLGFYRYGNDDYCEPLEMNALLGSLHEWFQDRISLEDTLLWDDETPGYSHR